MIQLIGNELWGRHIVDNSGPYRTNQPLNPMTHARFNRLITNLTGCRPSDRPVLYDNKGQISRNTEMMALLSYVSHSENSLKALIWMLHRKSVKRVCIRQKVWTITNIFHQNIVLYLAGYMLRWRVPSIYPDSTDSKDFVFARCQVLRLIWQFQTKQEKKY